MSIFVELPHSPACDALPSCLEVGDLRDDGS